MTRKKPSRAAKVRAMLNKGMTPKEVADLLGIKRQVVYTIRYMDNKKKGIGALPKPEVITEGIAAVRRKTTPSSRQPIVVPPEIRSPGEFVSVKATEMERQAKESTQWVLAVLLVVVALGVVILAVK